MRPAAIYLRLIDPRTGNPILVPEEVYQDFDEVSREYAAARRDTLAAEGRAESEARARQAAEERAARAEAALRAALAQLEQRQHGT